MACARRRGLLFVLSLCFGARRSQGISDAELLAAAGMASGSSPPPPPAPVPLPPPHAKVNLVVDTDMSIDVDDVGALCIAHALADAGEANLIAVTQDTANAHGIGAIMAINRYYGRSTPVGSYSGRVGDKEHTPSYWDDWTLQGQGWYTEGLAATSPVPAEATADSVRILRAALAAASADSKVTIAAIGRCDQSVRAAAFGARRLVSYERSRPGCCEGERARVDGRLIHGQSSSRMELRRLRW